MRTETEATAALRALSREHRIAAITINEWDAKKETYLRGAIDAIAWLLKTGAETIPFGNMIEAMQGTEDAFYFIQRELRKAIEAN